MNRENFILEDNAVPKSDENELRPSHAHVLDLTGNVRICSDETYVIFLQRLKSARQNSNIVLQQHVRTNIAWIFRFIRLLDVFSLH